MSAYFIAVYDIHDPATYAKYVPESMETIGATLERHGGKALVANPEAEWISEDRRLMVVVLEFPTVEAAHAWHSDPDYQAVAQFRLASTEAVLACVAAGAE